MRPSLRIVLAQPRGFCAGVRRAVEIVEQALLRFSAPVYVLHAIVHNRHVVKLLEKKGAIFVEALEEVPPGAPLVFSAHGVSGAVEAEAQRRGCVVIDATCPLVKKVHLQVERASHCGARMVLIGHEEHAEVRGSVGRYLCAEGGIEVIRRVEEVAGLDPATCAFVTQTTLGVDATAPIVAALRQRFPKIIGPRRSDICEATTLRQAAVGRLAAQVDSIVVVGSESSSNGQRLVEVARAAQVQVQRVDDASELVLSMRDSVGITAAASTPEHCVRSIIQKLQEAFNVEHLETLPGPEECVTFRLPLILRSR